MEEEHIPKEPLDVTKKRRFESVINYLKRRPSRKRLLIVSSVSLAVLLVGVLGLRFFGPTGAEPNPMPVISKKKFIPPKPILKASPLTGVMVSPALADRAVTGIMIENSLAARPQSGLSDAGVVFEAIAEGGITRFLALYQEAQPTNIGPIRSARPYYVQWVAGFDAAYVHSGGSGEALQLIKTLGIKNMDHGIYGNSVASRVSYRFAPHNVYTSMAKLDAKRKVLGFNTSNFTPFERKKDTLPTEATPATAVTINFNISGAYYNTQYIYDAVTNSYKRNMAGKPHIDKGNGKQIMPKVVIALETTYGIHPDRIHSVYKTIGSGDVLVFQDGMVTKGKWHKQSAKAPLTFTNTSGKALRLNVGQTWITAIQTGRTTYKP